MARACLGNLQGQAADPLRGLHYALISTPDLPAMPDGQAYQNAAECWEWLQRVANKARWLRVIPFEDVTDERNAAPQIHTEYVDDDEPEGIDLTDDLDALSVPSLAMLLPTVTSGSSRHARVIGSSLLERSTP